MGIKMVLIVAGLYTFGWIIDKIFRFTDWK